MFKNTKTNIGLHKFMNWSFFNYKLFTEEETIQICIHSLHTFIFVHYKITYI